jgi:hypothetical protein
MCKVSYVGVLVLATALSMLTGCSKTISVIQTPDFYSPDLKTVAVAPFRNQTSHQGAGDIISDKVSACLVGNGTYKVFNRNDLKAVMDEKDLQIALGSDAAASAAQRQKLTNVQAILVGTVATYDSTSNSQPRQDPIYAFDSRGNMYISGYRNYVWTRNEGNVSVTANLIRVSDGTVIATTARPPMSQAWAEGSPPSKDPHACLAEASDGVAVQLVEWFAPVRKQVKIDATNTIRLASELYDNRWTFQDTYKVGDKKMFVVVELPPVCDRNQFRLTIVRKEGRTDLAERDIRWSKEHKSFGYDFDPSEIAAKGGGPGDYEVKFYSGPEPVLRRAFRIR